MDVRVCHNIKNKNIRATVPYYKEYREKGGNAMIETITVERRQGKYIKSDIDGRQGPAPSDRTSHNYRSSVAPSLSSPNDRTDPRISPSLVKS